MKAKNSLPNLVLFVTLVVFGLFSFPVQRTAGAKFSPADLENEPEMAVRYVTPDRSGSTGISAQTAECAASNTKRDFAASAP